MATYSPVPARRGSLVVPIIVLLLGVGILINNFRPELSLWNLFAVYWPFLLIFWGLARLVEYVAARHTSRPIASCLSAGEVVLAILICLAGTAMFSARGAGWGSWRLPHRGLEVFGENYDFPVQASREIPPDATLVIRSLRGNVRVVGLDSREMRITGRKSIRAFSRGEADKADRATPLSISVEGSQVFVRFNQDAGQQHVSIDLDLAVPQTAAVTFEGRNNDLDIKDVAGPVEVSGLSGGVRLSNIAKNVRVSLRRSDVVRAAQVKGDIEISGRGRDIELDNIAGAVTINGDFSGNIKFQDLAKPVRYTSSRTELSFTKLPGRLEMDLGSLTANDVVGPFRLHARTKDVRLEDFSNEVEISSSRGAIELRTTKTPLANIQAESKSGDIKLELPGNARFSLQATTADGKAKNEFGDSISIEGRGKSAEMRGAVRAAAGAGAQIRLSTGRGDIVLKKFSPVQSL